VLKLDDPNMTMYFQFYSQNNGLQHWGVSAMFKLDLSDGMTAAERKNFVVIPKPKKITPWDKTVEKREIQIIKVPADSTTLNVSIIVTGAICLLLLLAIIVYSFCKKKDNKNLKNVEVLQD
jgi:hypothetical protein